MTTKRFLLTGARAPAALELAKNLAESGIEVHVADSIPAALTYYSKWIASYCIVPSPKQETDSFIDRLTKVVKQKQIDWLVPTCEEIFYIAKHKEKLEPFCKVFCEDFIKLIELHDKYRFIQKAASFGLKVPATNLCRDNYEVEASLKDAAIKIAKPVFSRFSSKVVYLPHQRIEPDEIHDKNPWVVQEFIAGNVFCSYSIAHKGEIRAHVVYQSKFRAGKGATIHFQPIQHTQINQWVDTFIQKSRFTGQIAFDFVVDKNRAVYAIECNPRLTSGIHLFRNQPIANAILHNQEVAAAKRSLQIKAAMMLYLVPNIKEHGWKHTLTALFQSRDIVFDRQDIAPFWKQLHSCYYFWKLSRQHRIRTMEATTLDIAWDGGEE